MTSGPDDERRQASEPTFADVMASVAAEARKRPAAHPDILATSSEGGMGIPELLAAVLEAIG